MSIDLRRNNSHLSWKFLLGRFYHVYKKTFLYVTVWFASHHNAGCWPKTLGFMLSINIYVKALERSKLFVVQLHSMSGINHTTPEETKETSAWLIFPSKEKARMSWTGTQIHFICKRSPGQCADPTTSPQSLSSVQSKELIKEMVYSSRFLVLLP